MLSLCTNSSEKKTRDILQHWEQTCTAGLVSLCTLPAVFFFIYKEECCHHMSLGKKKKRILKASQKHKQKARGNPSP